MDVISVSDDMREQFYQLFPQLRHTPHRFTSNENTTYNCVAWAVGEDHRWWDPSDAQLYYWPIENHDNSINSFLQAFQTQCFILCSDHCLEEGIEKIAIYMKNNTFKHVARQLSTGEWTSKCGQTFDIIHTLEGLTGDGYGMVTHLMQRSRKEAG